MRLEKVLSQIADRSSMETFFDKLYTARRKRPPLNALVLFTELEAEALETMIASRKKLYRKYFVKISPIDDHLYSLQVRRIMGKQGKQGLVLLDTSRKGAWVLFTNEGSYFVAHVLERMIEGLYPEISRFYMNHIQMNKLLNVVERSYDGEKTVTFFVTRRESLKSPEESGKRGTFILWEEMGEEELQIQTRKYRLTVDKLNFLVRDQNDSILLQAHMSRKGLFKLRFGSFRSFCDNVIHEAISMGLGLKKFYSFRGRMEKDGEIILNPVQIAYSSDFSKDQLIALANRLNRGYSNSIIHSGNPYFAASICDYQDGSSFGITALGNTVTITPISRATPCAIWKLTDKIQGLLGDGELSGVIAS